METNDTSNAFADRDRLHENERAAVGGFARSLVGLRGLRLLQVPADLAATGFRGLLNHARALRRTPEVTP